MLWGVYFGIIIMLEKYTILKVRDKIPSVFLHLYSLFLIVIGWVLFYFTDFEKIGQFMSSLFGGGSAGGWDYLAQNALTSNLWLIIASIICCIPFGRFIRSFYDESGTVRSAGFAAFMTAAKTVCAAALLIASTLLLIGDTNNPFLYLRF